MKGLFESPRYANVTATLALIIALGGTSYAAIKLPANSVGSAQLKAGAVTSAKVKDRTLQAKDFKAGQLPKGAKGDAGAPGAPGTPGTPGTIGPMGPTGMTGPAQYPEVVYKTSAQIDNLNNMQNRGFVTCDPGMIAIGGGSFGFGDVGHNVNGSRPLADHSGWEAWMNNTTGMTRVFHVYAICSRASQVTPRPVARDPISKP